MWSQNGQNVTRLPGSGAWRGRLAAVAATVLIAGCESSSKPAGCAGLATSHHYYSIIVGVPLTKRFACQTFGEPRSVRQLVGGRERWSYGKAKANSISLVITVR